MATLLVSHSLVNGLVAYFGQPLVFLELSVEFISAVVWAGARAVLGQSGKFIVKRNY
jgi:hypothetical protein